jgi:uncharacterized OB-fold protein
LAAHFVLGDLMTKTPREYAQERNARGLCCSCGNQHLPDKSRCAECDAKAKEKYRLKRGPKKVVERSIRKEQLAAASKRYYENKKAQGLCPTAGCHLPASADSIYCMFHLEQQRTRQTLKAAVKAVEKTKEIKQQIEVRRSAGLCVDCESTDLFNKLRCRNCEANWLVRENNLTRYAARLRVGLCQQCDAVVSEGQKYCEVCTGKATERREQRAAAGLCVVCGTIPPAAGRRLCQRCLDRVKEVYRERQAQGLCAQCGNTAVVHGNSRFLCESCCVLSRARYRKRHAAARRQILDAYGNKCACCGDPREWGLQLDHVNNDGNVHRRLLAGVNKSSVTYRVYSQVIREGFPKDKYQLLCSQCNTGKARNNGVCPHVHERAVLGGRLAVTPEDFAAVAAALAALELTGAPEDFAGAVPPVASPVS